MDKNNFLKLKIPCGLAIVKIESFFKTIFYEVLLLLEGYECVSTPNIKVAFAHQTTIFITNESDTCQEFFVYFSPDGENYIINEPVISVHPNETEIVVPRYYSKYIRIQGKSDGEIKFRINIQQQIIG
ncbi:DUF6385 domain-containing protein [Clostridium sp. ATCC 25772]|uniref:DUF6385 domain-containing protein n=1 Tax=Clostridium sp. ATCC 25772 TaxID=1676991 RepID=UPI000784A3E5|nr:DUF6385 domain-containing protein [Clostridium sp. ATCC 25772]